MTKTISKAIEPYHPSHCPQCNLPTEADRPFCSLCRLDLRYGSPHRVKSGKCIYCEKDGKFSKEHIFPEWLQKRYPCRSQETLHHLIRPGSHIGEGARHMHKETDSRPGDPYKTTVLNVCIPCNTGWMSGLQIAAQALVIRLADGEWPEFDESECALLARWITMVSINIQCHARMLATTQHQRTMLMQGLMPSGWRVSIGLMKNTDCAGNSFHRAAGAMIGMGDWEYLPIHSTYFCIERAAFHTLSSLDDMALQYGMCYGIGEIQLPMRQIWPFNFFADRTVGRDLVKDDLLGIQRQFGTAQ
jgi:hypothetical protein